MTVPQNRRRPQLFHLTTPFFNLSSFTRFENSLKRMLDNSGVALIVQGSDLQVTVPETIRKMAKLESDYSTLTYRLWPPTVFHEESFFKPRITLIGDKNDEYTVVFGSTDLTIPQQFSCPDANVVVRGQSNNEVVQQSIKIFNQLTLSEELVAPWSEWIAKYEEIKEEMKTVERQNIDQLQDLLISLHKLSPQSQPWTPNSQLECVIRVLQDLETQGSGTLGTHLSEIYEKAELIARYYNLNYEFKTFHNSIRRVLNQNSGNQGERLFRRLPNEDAKTGIYTLSLRGKQYSGVGRKSSTV